MKGIKLFVLAATTVAAFSAAASTMAAMAIPMGWYIEGNVGSSKSSNNNYGSNLSGGNSGTGWNINGGYKFMPYFAGEVGYTQYVKGKVKYNSTNVANDSPRYSYYLAGKGILPISDSGFDLFAKLGVARISTRVQVTNQNLLNANGVGINAGSHTATGAYFGFGGDYNFTPAFTINAQWNRAKGNSNTGNLDLYSVGLSYIFG